MHTDSDFRIALLPGDGVGIEIMDACLDVLNTLTTRIGGFCLATERLAGGAAYYRDTGVALPDESFEAAEKADAILFGAMGLPDGTEVNPQINFRMGFELYAGVRPIKAMANNRTYPPT